MTRAARLRKVLAAQGHDAFVATQRPNQLYFTPHAEPVSGLPPIPFLVLTGETPIAIPGPMFYYACRDQLTQCTVVKTEVDDPSAQGQLAATINARGWRRVAFDQLPPALADALHAAAPDTRCVAEPKLGPTLRRTKEPGE